MADSEGPPVPEESPQAAWDTECLDARLQRLADLVQDLKRRAESWQSHAPRQLFTCWEQEDARREEAERKAQWEEYERRMRESDARIEENMRDIRRRLDALERRWDKKRGAREPPSGKMNDG
jgi:chromosome segregation ATPase